MSNHTAGAQHNLDDYIDMAPSATNGDAIAVLEEIKAPPGVVLPPKEIKGASNGLPQVQKD